MGSGPVGWDFQVFHVNLPRGPWLDSGTPAPPEPEVSYFPSRCSLGGKNKRNGVPVHGGGAGGWALTAAPPPLLPEGISTPPSLHHIFFLS